MCSIQGIRSVFLSVRVYQAGIKAVLILDAGVELCTVGFLGKNIAALKKSSDKFLNKFAQVIELYNCSENHLSHVLCEVTIT